MEFPPPATMRAVVTVELATTISISTFPAFSPSPSPEFRVLQPVSGPSRCVLIHPIFRGNQTDQSQHFHPPGLNRRGTMIRCSSNSPISYFLVRKLLRGFQLSRCNECA